MMKNIKAGNGVLNFVNIDPVEKPKLWPKSMPHKTRRFILLAPNSNSKLEYLKAFHQVPGGLLAVAARVQEIRPDIECVIVDEAMGDEFPEDLEPGNDLVGITANTAEANYAYTWTVKLREKYPELPIVCGGPHFTFQPEEALHFFDVVFQGESEGILPQFFEDLKQGNLKSIYNGRLEPVKLDRPDFPVLEPKKFLQKPDEYGSNVLLTSRGCNNNCIFCAERAFSGKGVRYLNMDRVKKLLENLPEKPVIYVADDNIIANRERAIELAGLLKELKVSWLCHSNITIGDDFELLKILGKSGCVMVVIGIESIEENNIKSIGKAHINKPANYEKQLNNIRNIGGMAVYGEFMLWGEGSRYPDSIVKLADWIHSQHAIECIQITIETPIPGTKLREIREKQNRILTVGPYGKKITWDDYDFTHITQDIPGISPEQALRAFHWIYGKLYGTKPLHIWKYLPSFLKTHFIHSQSTFINKLVGTIFSLKFHSGVRDGLKMHEMDTPDGKVRVKTL